MIKLINKYKNMSPAIKASVWFAVCSIIQKSISFITVPVFTRLLPSHDYGLFNVYQSWLTLISMAITLNLTANPFMSGFAKFNDDKERFLSSMQGLSLTLVSGAFVIYIMFRGFFNGILDFDSKFSTFIVICMFIEIFFSIPSQYWSVTKRYNYNYISLVLFTLGMLTLNMVMGIVFVFLSRYKGEARIFVSAAIQFLFGVFLLFKNFSKGKTIFVAKYWKFALLMGIPLVPHHISQIILNTSDRIMINSMCGADKAGIYSVVYSFSAIMTFIANSINNSFVPWTYQSLMKGRYSKMNKVAMILLTSFAVCVVSIILFAPELIFVLAPEEYYEAIYIVPPVCASVYFIFQTSLFTNVEIYYEKTRFIAMSSVFSAIMNVGLNYLFIPRFGYIAAGYTTFISYLFIGIMHMVFVRKCITDNNGKIYDIKKIFTILSIVTVVSVLMAFVYKYMLLRYIIIAIIMIAIFIKRNIIIDVFKTIKDKQ